MRSNNGIDQQNDKVQHLKERRQMMVRHTLPSPKVCLHKRCRFAFTHNLRKIVGLLKLLGVCQWPDPKDSSLAFLLSQVWRQKAPNECKRKGNHSQYLHAAGYHRSYKDNLNKVGRLKWLRNERKRERKNNYLDGYLHC